MAQQKLNESAKECHNQLQKLCRCCNFATLQDFAQHRPRQEIIIGHNVGGSKGEVQILVPVFHGGQRSVGDQMLQHGVEELAKLTEKPETRFFSRRQRVNEEVLI